MGAALITHEAGPVTPDRKQFCLRCGYVLCDYSRPFSVISEPDDPNPGPAFWLEGPVTVDGNMSICGFQEGAILCQPPG